MMRVEFLNVKVYQPGKVESNGCQGGWNDVNKCSVVLNLELAVVMGSK